MFEEDITVSTYLDKCRRIDRERMEMCIKTITVCNISSVECISEYMLLLKVWERDIYENKLNDSIPEVYHWTCANIYCFYISKNKEKPFERYKMLYEDSFELMLLGLKKNIFRYDMENLQRKSNESDQEYLDRSYPVLERSGVVKRNGFIIRLAQVGGFLLVPAIILIVLYIISRLQ